VLDVEPEEWPAAALEPYQDVLSDPVAWARKAAGKYQADVICLWLAGTDPNGRNLSADHAVEVTRRVVEAIEIPLIVWGVSSDEKNTEVLKAVAEACAGHNLVLGPVTEGNYKQIGAAAIAYKHCVAANTPIDINLAKQLNILLENLGVPTDRILIDPTTGSVGYGLEYCYSIMERIRQAALTQNDDKLQYPVINNIAEEVWKTKEAKLSSDVDMKLGDASQRGINLEAITALSCLQAGSDLLIVRHPRTLAHVRGYIERMLQLSDLESMQVDLSLVELPKPPEPSTTAPAAPSAAPAKTQAAPPKQAIEKPQPLESPSPPAEASRDAQPVAMQAAQSGLPAPSPHLQRHDAVQLTDEDIEALREMLAMFRAVRNVFSTLAKLAQG
jgi:CO dehydrogenase/acetyl-CoA synthase delta subunit